MPALAGASPIRRPKLVLIDGFHNIFRAFFAIRSPLQLEGRCRPTRSSASCRSCARSCATRSPTSSASRSTSRTRRCAPRSTPSTRPTARRCRRSSGRRSRYIRRAIEAFRIPRLELDNYEADDVMGTLAEKAAAAGYDVVLVSADKDMMQLVGAARDALPHRAQQALRRRRRHRGLRRAAGAGRRRPGADGRRGRQRPRRAGDRREGGEAADRRVRLGRGLLERADEAARKAYRGGPDEPSRAGAPVEGAGDDPLPTCRSSSIPSRCARSAGHRGAARALLRARVLHACSRSSTRRLPADAPAAASSGVRLRRAASRCVRSRSGRCLLPRSGIAPRSRWPRRRLPWRSAIRSGVGRSRMGRPARSGDARGGRRRRSGPGARSAQRSSSSACDSRSSCGWRRGGGGGGRARSGSSTSCSARTCSSRPCTDTRSTRSPSSAWARSSPKAKEVGFDKGKEPPAVGDPRLGRLGRRAARRDVGAWSPSCAPSSRRRAAALCRSSTDSIEAPLAPVLMRHGGGRHPSSTCRSSPPMSVELAAKLAELEGADLRSRRREVQHPVAAAARRSILFEKLRPRRRQEDQEDQELVDRRRRRSRSSRRRATRCRRRSAALSRARQVEVDLRRRAAAVVGAGRPAPHPLPPGGGGDRAPLVVRIRTCRTSRSAPRSGSRIRKAFRAAPGTLLVVADYSQIELRVLAHIAGEKAMIEAFASGEDIHRSTAATVLGDRRDLVTAEQRRAAKTINFGLIYGMSAFGLGARLGISGEGGRAVHRRLLRALLGRAGLHEGDARSGRARRLRRDPLRPDPASCRTCRARTGTCARTPAGWRSTPASRAPRPTF